MGFFSRAKALAQNAARKVITARNAFDKSISRKPNTSKAIDFSMDINTSQAAGRYEAAVTIFFSGVVTDTILREIGQSALEEVRRSLDPISRTGGTASSFKYKINSADNSVTVYSDAPQAGSILTGIRTVPSRQSLIDWMANKPEFSGYDSSTQERIAFNIQERIRQGKTPGGASDLRTLNPSGQRGYNYLEVAMQQIEADVRQSLSGLMESL